MIGNLIPRMGIVLVALLVSVVGAGSFAQATGLVDGKAIKNHSVGFNKLTKGAVKQLRGGSGVDGFDGIDGRPGLDGQNGGSGQPGAPGDLGQRGLPGLPGSAGAPGAPGAAANISPTRVAGAPSPALPATAGGSVISVATCPTGQHVLGGGYSTDTWQQGVTVTESAPSATAIDPATWTAVLVNETALANTSVVTAYAVCA